MASVFQESNEVLVELWKEYNPTQEEYLNKEQVIEWIKSALEKTNTLQNFQDSLTDLEGLIKQYLSQVHEVNEEGLQNLSLSYPESVDFLKWLTQTETEEPNNIHQEKSEEPKQEEKEENFSQPREKTPEKEPSLHNEVEQEMQHSRHSRHSEHQVNMSRSNSSPKMKNSSIRNQFHEPPTLINNSHHHEEPLAKKINTEVSHSEEAHENVTVSAHELNLQTLSKKYKDYLRIIFEHYCKVSYATGQDPTFQQIHHKTTIMTITKFMMFCKDFQISKTSPSINRNFLVQIFKKNSECYKQMSFEQFDTVLKKLALLSFSDGVDPDQNKERTDQGLLSFQMVKMLQFCQLSNPRKFRQKMKRLNIQYRSGPKTNAEMKVVPDNYRFKFASNNGKSEEQVKQEVEERRQHRSERKILLQQKNSNSQAQPHAFRKRTQSKRTERMVYTKERELTSIREAVTKKDTSQSSNALHKILNPPIPPKRKVSDLPPHPPKTGHTPLSSSNQGRSSESQNIFKKELGYAQLHKLKQSEGYGKKKFGLNKSNSRDQKNNFKLNSIVEQARLQMKEQNAEGGQLSDSIATNSRQQTNRSRMYDVNKINSKMQIINQKNQRDRQIHEELSGILDISNDEDQFLKQHLEREKKNELINKRLSQRIQELDRQF